MTAREILNLIDWLREQGFDNDKIVECIEIYRIWKAFYLSQKRQGSIC